MCQFPRKITNVLPSSSSPYVSYNEDCDCLEYNSVGRRLVQFEVPCGKWLECRKQRANAWAFDSKMK